jgi:hypothetical protein
MTTRIVAATLAVITLAGAAGAQEFKGASFRSNR